MNGSREEEQKMLYKLRYIYCAREHDILEHVLGVLSADETCYILNEMIQEFEDGNRGEQYVRN